MNKITPYLLAACLMGLSLPALGQATGEELEELLGEAAAPDTTTSVGAPSSATGVSNAFNPAISVLGLMLGSGSENTPTKFGLQEFELRFTSEIDAYMRADITIAFPDTSENPDEPTVELEAAILSTTALPQWTVQFGKFWLPFGKHNRLHTHQFPFVSRPLVVEDIFGEEALNELAVEASPLLPTPFFSELNLVVFQGDNEPLFNFAGVTDAGTGEFTPDGAPNKARYLVHSKNLFETGEESTLEVGLSWLEGLNNAGKETKTTVSGLDLTYKWRSAEGRGSQRLVLQLEWVEAEREMETEQLDSSGYYLSLQYQVARQWWVQTRYGQVSADVEMVGGGYAPEDSAHSDFLIAWTPSEFSAFRMQYSEVASAGSTPIAAWYLQYNFSIGSHPAHAY